MKKMKKQLVKLLNIHAVSGKETPVRQYLQPILKNSMDTVTVDKYGNLLAEKKIGSGFGATILLSAHMDTVKGVLADRELLVKDGIYMSSKGALGGDDRAGIAIIMEVLRNIEKLSFDGNVKVAFSREEEIGCIGATNIDPEWYSDVDLAIVVDRKGSRDIVVGCYDAFCSNAVGDFFENVSAMQNMNWTAVEGGISDALVFSENKINSVNLSAGYMNEHTPDEYLVFDDMKDTVNLILQAFAVINNFYGGFGEVPSTNKWVKGWDNKYSKYGKSYGNTYIEDADGYYPYDEYTPYYEDEILEGIYAQEKDKNGDVYVYEVGANVIVQQDGNEIILTRESLKSLMNQISVSI